MPIKILSTANAPRQELYGDKIRLGDTEDTELQTKAQVENEIIPSLVPIQSTQFSTNLGVTRLDTIYLNEDVPDITFEKSAIYGTEEAPIYDKLTASIAGANHKSNVLIIHSGELEPTILTAAKPISPRSLPYTDQSAMLADQASQVDEAYYYYTGSTSAWRYNGVANGVIGDYTEVLEVPGWQEWGTRPHENFAPTWLDITGTYLVGVDNINYMDFTYSRITGKVNLVITQKAGGNLDPNKPNLNLIFHNDYNENVSPAQPVNKSWYGSDFVSTLLGLPSEAAYELISGSNYSLNLGLASNSQASRAREEVTFPVNWERFFVNEEITIVWVGEIRDTGTDQTRHLFGNLVGSPNHEGFSFEIGPLFNLRFGVSTEGVSSTTLNSATGLISENSGRWFLAATFKRFSNVLSTVTFYRKSPANGVAFTTVSSHNSSSDRSLRSGSNIMRLDQLAGSTVYRGVKRDDIRVYNRVLDATELESLSDILLP